MNFSFYSGAVGAQSMQDRMNVIANNIANLNTEGYKTKNGTFSDLVISQMGFRTRRSSRTYSRFRL